MGGGRFSSADYSSFRSSHTVGKSTAQVFTSRSMPEELDPLKFKDGRRESVDSADNPNSLPIAIFCDQTGSMGALADQIIRTSLGVIVESIYQRGFDFDPHVLVGGIGDAYNREQAPLQASQFEASALPILEQLKKIFLEANGGGNGGESYSLAHLFASHMTTFDAWNKRKRKGFLFTLGDEPIHGANHYREGVTSDQAKQYLGLDFEGASAAEIHRQAAERWEIFHIDVRDREQDTFRSFMGERFLKIPSIDILGETIVSAIQVTLGDDAQKVAASWGGSTAVTLAKTLSGLPSATAGGAVARL